MPAAALGAHLPGALSHGGRSPCEKLGQGGTGWVRMGPAGSQGSPGPRPTDLPSGRNKPRCRDQGVPRPASFPRPPSPGKESGTEETTGGRPGGALVRSPALLRAAHGFSQQCRCFLCGQKAVLRPRGLLPLCARFVMGEGRMPSTGGVTGMVLGLCRQGHRDTWCPAAITPSRAPAPVFPLALGNSTGRAGASCLYPGRLRRTRGCLTRRSRLNTAQRQGDTGHKEHV